MWVLTGERERFCGIHISGKVNQNALDLRGDTVANMSSRMQTRRRRRLLALALAAVAVVLVVVEPFPKGNCCSR